MKIHSESAGLTRDAAQKLKLCCCEVQQRIETFVLYADAVATGKAKGSPEKIAEITDAVSRANAILTSVDPAAAVVWS